MDATFAYIGVDIGGTSVKLGLVSREGMILRRERMPTDINRTVPSFLERLRSAVHAMLAEAERQRLTVSGMGVGVPGLIGNDGFVHSSVNLLALEGKNLCEEISAFVPFPVTVVNDVNAFAWGEKIFGAGRRFSSFLMLTLGTGVGGGLIMHDRLWSGIDGCAGEYGHATVEPEGRECGCGNRGCLEQYASATALVAAARSSLECGAESSLSLLPAEDLTAGSIGEAARRNDRLARSLFEEAGKYLGIAAATAANLLNLEAMIISGGVAESFDLMEAAIRRELSLRAFPLAAARMQVLRGDLGDDAGILGNAAMVMR